MYQSAHHEAKKRSLGPIDRTARLGQYDLFSKSRTVFWVDYTLDLAGQARAASCVFLAVQSLLSRRILIFSQKHVFTDQDQGLLRRPGCLAIAPIAPED